MGRRRVGGRIDGFGRDMFAGLLVSEATAGSVDGELFVISNSYRSAGSTAGTSAPMRP